MGSENEQQTRGKHLRQPSISRPLYMEYGGPVMDFRYARNEVMDRLDAARAAGNAADAGRLEEEAEVLWWKMCRAINPAREVPATILAKFECYPNHPPLPA